MKPNLLLLHGALGCKDSFQALLPLLTPDFNVKAMNLPGHGGLALPETGLLVDVLVTSVENFIETEFPGLDPVFVFGYSLGGYLGLLASKTPDSRIAGVLTLATKLDWNEDIAHAEVQKLNPTLLEEKLPHFVSEITKQHHPTDWKLLVTAVADMLQELGKRKLLDTSALSSVHVLCRLMLGDRDKMVGFEETLHAYRSIPGASLVMLPNTPHSIEKADTHRLAFEIKTFYLS